MIYATDANFTDLQYRGEFFTIDPIKIQLIQSNFNLISIKPLFTMNPKHEWFPNEYPCARVSVNFQLFLPHFVIAKLATSSTRNKNHA